MPNATPKCSSFLVVLFAAALPVFAGCNPNIGVEHPFAIQQLSDLPAVQRTHETVLSGTVVASQTAGNVPWWMFYSIANVKPHSFTKRIDVRIDQALKGEAAETQIAFCKTYTLAQSSYQHPAVGLFQIGDGQKVVVAFNKRGSSQHEDLVLVPLELKEPSTRPDE